LRCVQLGFQDVTLVAETFAPIPSKSSPAVYRPAWMGKTPAELTVKWGLATQKELARIARKEGSDAGVTSTVHIECFTTEAGPDAAIPDPALKAIMPGFRDATELEMQTFCPHAAGGWVYSTFMIEGMRFLKYLEAQCEEFGEEKVKVIMKKVEGPAQSEEWCRSAISIADKPQCRIVVNAMGINGGPECYPIRGDLVLVRAPYIKLAIGEYRPKDKTRPTYIYPRRDHVVLGSYYLEGDGNREERPESTADVIARCCQFVPELSSAPIIGVVPCIRPGRKDGVRLDEIRAGDFHVVNNYGHGGGGMGISWGCALDVVELVEKAAEELTKGLSRL